MRKCYLCNGDEHGTKFDFQEGEICYFCKKRADNGKLNQRVSGDVKTDPETGGLLLGLKLPVVFGDCYGDQMSIDQETQSLWVSTYFTLDDLDDPEQREDLDEFFKSNFYTRDGAKGFVRRALLNRGF